MRNYERFLLNFFRLRLSTKYCPSLIPRIFTRSRIQRTKSHPKGSKLVSDACFLSGLLKIETEIGGKSQEKWRPKKVYHYIQWKNIEPDFIVDVSGFIDKKVDAILAYGSQFFDPKSNEPETPITSKNFLDSVTYRAKDLGRIIGVEYAEGFTSERFVAVKNLDKLF